MPCPLRRPQPLVRIEGDTLVYESAPGDKDRVTADEFETKTWDINGAFVQAGPACEQAPPEAYGPQLTCPLRARATIDLGDQDDTVGVFVQNLTVTISGGDGNDLLGDRDFHGTIDGGSGRDRITRTDPGEIIGGPGNDTIHAFQGAVVDAGAGDDRVTPFVRATPAYARATTRRATTAARSTATTAHARSSTRRSRRRRAATGGSAATPPQRRRTTSDSSDSLRTAATKGWQGGRIRSSRGAPVDAKHRTRGEQDPWGGNPALATRMGA